MVEAGLRCTGGLVEPMTRDTLAPCVTSDRVLLANPQIGTSAPPQRAIRPVKIFLPRPTDVLSELVTAFVSILVPARPHRPSAGVTQRESGLCGRTVEESGGSSFTYIDFNVFLMFFKICHFGLMPLVLSSSSSVCSVQTVDWQ